MTERNASYVVIDFIEQLEEAIFNAKRHDMQNIALALENIHVDLVELGSLIDSEDRINRLTIDIEKPLEDIVVNCMDRKETESFGNLTTLSERIKTLREIWKA